MKIPTFYIHSFFAVLASVVVLPSFAEDEKQYLNGTVNTNETYSGTWYSTGVTFMGATHQTIDTLILESGTYTKQGNESSTTIGTLDASASGAKVYLYGTSYTYITNALILGDNALTKNLGFSGVLVLNSATATLTTNAMTIGVKEGSDSATLTRALVASATTIYTAVQGGSISALDVTNVTVSGDDITLSDVVFANSSVTANYLTLNDLSSTKGLSINADALTYTVTALDGALINVSDSITLNFDLTADEYNAFIAQDSVSVSLSGLTESSSLSGDIILNFSDGTNSTEITVDASKAVVGADGTVSFATGGAIPEPSTATLSLLALAALMARRRRMVA